MKKTYSLHKINNENEFSFDAEDYSLFKFGQIEIAKKFGKQLFEGFLKDYYSLLLNEEIYIFPSPYMAIPTASNYLAKFFKQELDKFLFENNLPSSKEGKIIRNQTYTTDYGNLSFEERKRLIANDTYYIDRNLLENKTCIFIDDIRITGSHEYTINKILDNYDVKGHFYFLYFAELINKDINPKIENFFNYKKINSIEALISLMNLNQFKPNTRVIKYLLSLNDDDFEKVNQSLKPSLREEISIYAISNDYHLIEQYLKNLKKLHYGYQLTKGTERKY